LKRRTYLTSMLGGALAGAHLASPHLDGQTSGSSIALDVDLEVDPAKEKKMLEIFHGPFHAAAMKQPGFIDVQMYKLRSTLQGPAITTTRWPPISTPSPTRTTVPPGRNVRLASL